jgi:hypothetical protein
LPNQQGNVQGRCVTVCQHTALVCAASKERFRTARADAASHDRFVTVAIAL